MDEQQKPAEAAAAPHATKSDAEQNKWYGVLAYLSILCLIPLFAAKSSPFAQFHAKQGLVLFLGGVVLNIVSVAVPSDLIGLIVSLASLVLGVMSLIGLINAFQGKMWEMPVVGDVAKKIKL